MTGETSITVIGNLTTNPELRRTPSGSAVANFTIASTPRSFDRQKNEWVDGETLFLRASVWREAAENVAESLTKGMRVIVSGLLKSRTFETKTGEKRTVIELEIEDIGASLRYGPIPSGFTKSEESPGANPGPDHAVTGGAHPAEEFTISPRQYSDVDDAWFGTHTNPAGRIGAGTPDA